MSTKRKIIQSLAFGVVAEAIAVGVSLILLLVASSFHGEPKYNPFLLTAIWLHMPGLLAFNGIILSFSWCVVFCIQALLWSIIRFIIFLWRDRKKRDQSA